tara:strand:- start:17227 stop:17475 length:249 start_codon:yes stop_codon:yes gene_type:complete
MTNYIKSAGFKTKRIDTSNYAGVFGGTCNHVIGLFNDKDEVLHLSGKAYFPCGRRSAFNALIESGDIKAPAFSWAEFNTNNK